MGSLGFAWQRTASIAFSYVGDGPSGRACPLGHLRLDLVKRLFHKPDPRGVRLPKETIVGLQRSRGAYARVQTQLKNSSGGI